MEGRGRICSLNVVPVEDVLELIQEVVKREIKPVLSSMGNNLDQEVKSETQTELYTRKETAEKLRVSLVTLDIWTKVGIIKAQRIGTRVRYSKKAIDEALKNVANKGNLNTRKN